MEKQISCLLFCYLVTTSVFAEETKYYFGASYLRAETVLMGETDKDSGFEARLGYIVNNSFSLEASYVDLGTLEFPKIADAGGSVESNGYSFAALGVYPISDFNLTGKVGYLWWDSDGYLGSIAGPRAFNADGGDLLIGGGLSYVFTENIEIKVEYNDSVQFNWVSLGVNYHF